METPIIEQCLIPDGLPKVWAHVLGRDKGVPIRLLAVLDPGSRAEEARGRDDARASGRPSRWTPEQVV